MFTRNTVGGIAATLIGGIYLYHASHLRVSSLADSFGPRGMPLAYGALTVALGLLLLGQSVVAVMRLGPEERAGLIEREWSGQYRKIARAAGLLAIAAVDLLLLPYLGYLVAVALLLVCVALYMGAAPGWRLAGIAIGGAAVMWLVFAKLLDVDLPAGVFAALVS